MSLSSWTWCVKSAFRESLQILIMCHLDSETNWDVCSLWLFINQNLHTVWAEVSKAHWFLAFVNDMSKQIIFWLNWLLAYNAAPFTNHPHKLPCLWPLTCFSLIFGCLFRILFSHSIHLFYISSPSLQLLTKPLCGLWLKIYLNADFLFSKSMGCDLEYIESGDCTVFSQFFAHTHILLAVWLFFTFTFIPPCFFSLLLHLYDPLITLHRL